MTTCCQAKEEYHVFDRGKAIVIVIVIVIAIVIVIVIVIVITRKDLALCTKTNQRPSSKQVRMEVRLVTVASRGFLFLSRQDLDLLVWYDLAHSRSFVTKKPCGTKVMAWECNFESNNRV